MSFERARREDQKAERRNNILAIARELCTEFGVMDWSLNELGRRADVTKSNLYRYFGSREEILLVLMHDEMGWYAAEVTEKIGDTELSVSQLCTLLADTFARNSLLCDLLSVSASILEQNVELEQIRDIKIAGLEHAQTVTQAIMRALGGLNEDKAARIALAAGVIVTGLWPMARPTAPLRQVAQFEGLESLALDFRTELRQMLEGLVRGTVEE